MTMEDYLVKKKGANFFGFERVDAQGKLHYNPYALKSNGDLYLTEKGVTFIQWGFTKGINIPFDSISRIDIRTWHNMKMKWPGKVLRLYLKEGDETKIFGVKVGGKLSVVGGWQDEAYVWKKQIEAKIAALPKENS